MLFTRFQERPRSSRGESTSRRWRVRTSAFAAALLAGGAGLYATQPAQAAPSTYGMTITSISPKKLAALTANETVTITGTNFDSSYIASVDLGPCTNSTFIVVSATSMVVKTPNATCGTATVGTTTPVTITVTDIDSNTLTFTGNATTGLFFVTPPTLAPPNEIFLDNSANVDKFKKAKSIGGQTVRIIAASDYQFTAGVTATLGGSALTNITVGGPVGNGNYITGTTPSRPAGGANLVVTANGVSKTYTSAATGFTYWTPPILSSVVPDTGRAVPSGGSGGNVVLTGTGFSTTAADNTVTFCGKAAVVASSPAPTATAITVAYPDPEFGVNKYEGVCPVVVSVGGLASPVTATTKFAYLIQ